MKIIVRLAKAFALSFVALAAVAGAIFPFTQQVGLRGYITILMIVCAGACGLGAVFVYAAQKSGHGNSGFEGSGLSADVLHEMRKEQRRGSDLGLELFYAGLACLAVVYLIFRNID